MSHTCFSILSEVDNKALFIVYKTAIKSSQSISWFVFDVLHACAGPRSFAQLMFYSTISILWKNSADDILKYFSYFSWIQFAWKVRLYFLGNVRKVPSVFRLLNFLIAWPEVQSTKHLATQMLLYWTMNNPTTRLHRCFCIWKWIIQPLSCTDASVLDKEYNPTTWPPRCICIGQGI